MYSIDRVINDQKMFRVQSMLATVLAVESSVLHNFVWHERFTWADRRTRRWRDAYARALHFNLTTGAVSIGGKLLLMQLLVGEIHLPVFFANLLSIAGCSVAYRSRRSRPAVWCVYGRRRKWG